MFDGKTIQLQIQKWRKLTEHFQFGGGLNDELRGNVVSGILNEATQNLFLTEGNLTPNCALEIAVSMETIAKEVRELQLHYVICATNKRGVN